MNFDILDSYANFPRHVHDKKDTDYHFFCINIVFENNELDIKINFALFGNFSQNLNYFLQDGQVGRFLPSKMNSRNFDIPKDHHHYYDCYYILFFRVLMMLFHKKFSKLLHSHLNHLSLSLTHTNYSFTHFFLNFDFSY